MGISPTARQVWSRIELSAIDPASLAEDATHIYWADPRTEIRKADLSSGLPATIVVGETDIVDIEVDVPSVYWLVGGSSFFPLLGSLKKAPKNLGGRDSRISFRFCPSPRWRTVWRCPAHGRTV